MNSITGETEVKTVSSQTIKRFFVIGDEPKLHVLLGSILQMK